REQASSMGVTKTCLLVPVLCAVAVCISAAQSLRDEADRAGILIGAAVNAHYLPEPAYTSILAREFNMVEPEDAMKWEAVRPDVKTFNLGGEDSIGKFADLHNMKVRGHTLVWGTHNPQWLTDGGYNSKQLADLLHDHIRQVVGHFRGKIFAWDVVNEAMDE